MKPSHVLTLKRLSSICITGHLQHIASLAFRRQRIRTVAKIICCVARYNFYIFCRRILQSLTSYPTSNLNGPRKPGRHRIFYPILSAVATICCRGRWRHASFPAGPRAILVAVIARTLGLAAISAQECAPNSDFPLALPLPAFDVGPTGNEQCTFA